MSLLVRINLAFGGVFVLAALVAGYVFWGILEGDARRQVLAEAGLMMDSALASRAYTSGEILPLLNGRDAADFLVINAVVYLLVVRPVRRGRVSPDGRCYA